MLKGFPSRYRMATGEIDTARLKADVSIVEVAGLVTDLKRSGEEHVGLCPLHHETRPSFIVNDAKGLFFCHGCSRGGDVIALVQQVSRQDFIAACEWLVGSDITCPERQQASAVAARVKRQLNLHRAKDEWRRAEPIAGTLAETYLGHRGIVGAVPSCLRFGNVPRFWRDDRSEGPRLPAMIAACQDVDGKVVGIQRTFLDRQGRKAGDGSARLSLGQIRGGALRLGPVTPRIMLATATEDALALTRMFPGATVWAAFGDANLPHVALPRAIKEVVLCGDDDASGHAAVVEAATVYRNRQLAVSELFPRAAKDFNEEWLLLHA